MEGFFFGLGGGWGAEWRIERTGGECTGLRRGMYIDRRLRGTLGKYSPSRSLARDTATATATARTPDS